jgi:hypothetical protein
MGLWTLNTECMSTGSSLVNNSCNSTILFTGSLKCLNHSDNKCHRYICYIGQKVHVRALPSCLTIILSISFQFTMNLYIYITIPVDFTKIQTVVPKTQFDFQNQKGYKIQVTEGQKHCSKML